MWIGAANDFKAGPLAIENYFVFSFLTNKPYAKVGFQSIGVLFAFLYLEFLDYKRTNDSEAHPKMSYYAKRRWISFILFILGGGLIIFSLLSGFEAFKKPYIWPLWLNLLYFGLNRYLHVLGAMIILFVILMKHFRGGQKLIGNKFMRFLAKITFIGGLISPIIIYDLYLGGERPILMTDRGNLVIGLGNIICIYLAGIPLYLAVEYPLKKLSEVTILDRISHYDLVRKHYEEEESEESGAGHLGPKPFNIQG